MKAYNPRTAWINGKEFPHPEYRQAFVDEVSRLLVQVHRIDAEATEPYVPGGYASGYDEWYADPEGYARWILQQGLHTLPPALTPEPPAPEPGDRPEPVKTLWRLKPSERRAAVRPFVGWNVRLERWYGRVAADGDVTYTGKILAVAITTIGTAADMAILETDNGTCWAISLAQVALLEAEGNRP